MDPWKKTEDLKEHSVVWKYFIMTGEYQTGILSMSKNLQMLCKNYILKVDV